MHRFSRTLIAFFIVTISTIYTSYSMAGICDNWHSGHYIRVPYMNGKNMALVSSMLEKNFVNYQGIVMQFNWNNLEPNRGEYNFTDFDDALQKARQEDKYIILMFMDRTFNYSASNQFAPDYLKTVEGNDGSNFCTVAIWEEKEMTNKIRVANAILNRYRSDPHLIGIYFNAETALNINKKETEGFTWEKYQRQLIRGIQEVSKANPDKIIMQGFNFPQDEKFMQGIVDGIKTLNNTGMFWPDTIIGEKDNWIHYDIARENATNFIIAPHVQTRDLELLETTSAYEMLNDIGAHMMVWDRYHKDSNDYLEEYVIPAIVEKKGYIKNSKCPFSDDTSASSQQSFMQPSNVVYDFNNQVGSRRLDRAVFDGTEEIYVYYDGPQPTNLDIVNFQIDNVWQNFDLYAPYKLYDGSLPLDLNTFSEGEHRIEVVLKDANRNIIDRTTATFRVSPSQR